MNLSTLFRASAPLFPPPHSTSSSRTNATENIAIEGRNLNFSTRTRQGNVVPILQDCTLRIPSGQFWMLLGPNGCGKSTLLKILAGLLNPNYGTVYVKGPKSFVFQNPDHQVVMPTVEADVAFGLGKLNMTDDEVRSRVSKALDAVGMSSFLKRSVQTLSGGQKQRVAIAGALAETCKVLLLDELTTFLDETDQVGVIKAVRNSLDSSEEVTALWVTHRLEELEYADGAVYMENGEIVMLGIQLPENPITVRLRVASGLTPFVTVAGWKHEAFALLGKKKSSSAMKPFEDNKDDVETGMLDKDRDKIARNTRGLKVHNQALLSGLAYCISSCSMILINKFVLSSYNFNAGISLMVYQNLISVIIVSTLSFLGVISTEPLTWRLVKVWLPVNVIFVGMLITSMFSLKYINVAMVTVLKNVTNVITAVGEMYLFSKHHDSRVWAALFLMIISAITGGITDISFHAVGYTWQIINCFLTASYSLTLRRVMDTAKQVTKSGNLNEFSMVLLNNTLSLPLGILLILVFNEVDYLSGTPLLRLPTFWCVMTLSGVLGLAISFTSMWFLHQTGATTYSLVGSLNKIPLSVAGIFLFHVPTSLENSASIFFGPRCGRDHLKNSASYVSLSDNYKEMAPESSTISGSHQAFCQQHKEKKKD
ncbi:GDP-mannose transporter GONST1 [Morella rubra]|uniref:GDP-mannose transporter GONST1 n=1 Tax=Morella rubra TaxID=262757 RepID=A0A6A1VFH4_9ROSI|nr:GDP-mannose transporter GONST1 [Morella rubra]